MTTSLTKGLIGKEDHHFATNELYPTDTFTRQAQLGGTQTMTDMPDVYKTHYSIINACHWNSGSKNDTTITQALSYIGANTRSLYLEPGAWSISNDLTIPANVELVVAYGATVTVASGKTLTINGAIFAPPKQIFAGTGTVTINSQGGRYDNTWKGNTNDCFYLYNEGFAADVNSFTDADTTPSVADGFVFKTANTGATTITSFDDGIAGQVIHILITDALTTLNFSSGNLRGYSSSTWTAPQYASVTARFDGSYWYCIMSSGGALLDAANTFTANQMLKGDALLYRFNDTGSGGKEYAICSDGGGLIVYENTGTEAVPTWTTRGTINSTGFSGDGSQLTSLPLPWVIDIDIFDTPSAQTNFSTISVNSSSLYNGRLMSSGAQNALVSWPIVLAAGTWKFSLIHRTDTINGIYSVQFDGSEKGTIDGYATPGAFNVISTITGISVTATSKITLTLKMATKNGSSSDYYGNISHVRLIRTA